MYKRNQVQVTTISVHESTEGETLEDKIERIVNNNEPITDGAPLVFTEKSQGVRPEYNIRTDRFEIAVDAMDYVNKTEIAKSEQRLADRKAELDKLNNPNKQKEDGKTEPTQGTEN